MTSTTNSEADVSESTDDDIKEAEAAEKDAEKEKPSAADAETDATPPSASRRDPWRWVAAVLLIALLGVGVFGYLKYNSVADELAAMRQDEANRNTAAQVATDYALKSLTYSFEDPDAFFRSVEEGVSPALKDKFVNASDLLKGVMLQAQVTSTGEVLATEVTSQPGDVYRVIVSASQTTRNLQNPQSRVSIVLLQITVNKIGDTWQVADIGPKTGSKPANADQVLPGQPAPVPPPGSTPAPATPRAPR